MLFSFGLVIFCYVRMFRLLGHLFSYSLTILRGRCGSSNYCESWQLQAMLKATAATLRRGGSWTPVGSLYGSTLNSVQPRCFTVTSNMAQR